MERRRLYKSENCHAGNREQERNAIVARLRQSLDTQASQIASRARRREKEKERKKEARSKTLTVVAVRQEETKKRGKYDTLPIELEP